jgi:cytochrome c oxidase assembly protein subunit 15
MHPNRSLFWFRRLCLVGALLAAAVIVLGAWVRLTDAGLGCPDWPGCYGHIYPQADHPFTKALHEMIHRYFASSLGIIVASLLVWASWRRRDPKQPVALVVVLAVLVCVQAALGRSTVTLLLIPLIVTSHLLGGLTTLGLLCWLSLDPPRETLSAREIRLRPFALAALGVLTLQIALGGWTSTNYAAVACPDLPTCRQSWWPPMDYRNAFVLWRGLNVNYEGGVLADPARVAIHFTHRLGAVVAGITLTSLGVVAALRARRRRLRVAGGMLAAAVLLQISLGASTVHWGVPLPLATLHNAGAALLVICMVALLRALWPGSSVDMLPLRGGHGTQ